MSLRGIADEVAGQETVARKVVRAVALLHELWCHVYDVLVVVPYLLQSWLLHQTTATLPASQGHSQDWRPIERRRDHRWLRRAASLPVSASLGLLFPCLRAASNEGVRIVRHVRYGPKERNTYVTLGLTGVDVEVEMKLELAVY